MRRKSISFVIILATISVFGIMLIQFFFLKHSFDLNEKQFHKTVSLALKSVAKNLIEYNNKLYGHSTQVSELCLVDQLSNNYYVVNVNDAIDPSLLEFYLVDEFKKHNIYIPFEYGIYDCESEKMIHGNLIIHPDSIYTKNEKDLEANDCDTLITTELAPVAHTQTTKDGSINLPVCDKYTYYFGVRFPERSKFYNSRLKVWYFITGMLLLVILFFGYAIYIILRQQQLSVIQKNFINNLTHEFRTPISSIDLSAKVLADPQIINQPERLSKYASIVCQQNDRLAAQVEKLLQMASIEKKRIKLEYEEIEINALLNQLITEFKNSINNQDVKITYTSNSDQSLIHVDKLHFTNLVFNILDNGVKYCVKKPAIEVSLIDHGKKITLSFEDNGIGIPKEFRKKIFYRFFRIPTGNIHDVKGFGLGLDYVKKISDMHHWKIYVTDNTQKGSTFIFKIQK